MKVLGTRKGGIWIPYILVLLMFSVGTVIIIAVDDVGVDQIIVAGIFSTVMVLVCVGILISYFSQPRDMIILRNNKELLLPENIVIPLYSITKVRYKRAAARGIHYKYGSVIISTSGEEHVCRYVSNCEEVSNQILELSNKAKAGNVDEV